MLRVLWRAGFTCGIIIPAAVQAQTPAGTPITNRASANYGGDGGSVDRASNADTLIVAELLDVAIERGDDTPLLVRPGAFAAPFAVINSGNGDEAFVVAASSSSDDVTIAAIAVDADGDGRFDAGRDIVIEDGRTPLLPPGGRAALLAVGRASTAAAPADGEITLVATAATGSGPPGAAFPGQGDGGGDAIVGTTGARATRDIAFRTTADAPSLVKAQSVMAPDGTRRAVRGAVITYTLQARFDSATGAARITDPLPDGTSYVLGSLRLDDMALTDAADADAGSVVAGEVSVDLAGPATGAVRTVQFQVKIQ